jgi:predicted MFS family arabinose efflux permease
MAARTLPTSRLTEGLGYLSLAATAALGVGPLVGVLVFERWGFTVFQMVVVATCLTGLLASLGLDPAQAAPPPPRSPSPGAAPAAGPGPWPAAFLAFLMGATNTAIFSFLALRLEELGRPGAAGFFAVATLGIAATRLVGGRLHDRHGPSWVVGPSTALLEAALLMLLLAPTPAVTLWAGLVYGLGLGALFPSLQVLAICSVPDSGKTIAAGLALNGVDLGLAVNTLAMGLLAGLAGGYRVVFAVTAAFPAILLATYALHPAFRAPGGGRPPGAGRPRRRVSAGQGAGC